MAHLLEDPLANVEGVLLDKGREESIILRSQMRETTAFLYEVPRLDVRNGPVLWRHVKRLEG